MGSRGAGASLDSPTPEVNTQRRIYIYVHHASISDRYACSTAQGPGPPMWAFNTRCSCARAAKQACTFGCGCTASRLLARLNCMQACACTASTCSDINLARIHYCIGSCTAAKTFWTGPARLLRARACVLDGRQPVFECAEGNERVRARTCRNHIHWQCLHTCT